VFPSTPEAYREFCEHHANLERAQCACKCDDDLSSVLDVIPKPQSGLHGGSTIAMLERTICKGCQRLLALPYLFHNCSLAGLARLLCDDELPERR